MFALVCAVAAALRYAFLELPAASFADSNPEGVLRAFSPFFAAVYAAEEMNFYFFTRDPFAFGLLALPALLGLILSAALLAVRAAKNKPTANADG